MKVKTIDVTHCGWCLEPLSNADIASTYDFTYQTCSNTFHYRRCQSCGCITLHNRPVQSSLQTIYPRNYSTYNYRKSLGASYLLKEIYNTFKCHTLVKSLHKVKSSSPKRNESIEVSVLDVGCGGGDFIESLRNAMIRLTKHRCTTTGIDILETRPPILDRYINSDVSSVVLPGSKYRIITCFQVIEHVSQPQQVLMKLIYALEPDGLLVIETPYFDSIDRRLFPTHKWAGLHAPRHWCLLSPEAVFSSINQFGNLKITLKFTPCPYMWITNLRHLFGINESTPLQSLLSTKNPLLVVLFTLIDYVLIFLRLPTSNAQYSILKLY